MSKSFEKYSNHLNVEQDLKYINLAIKLLEMEISEVYANEIYSIKYSYDIYDEYIKKNKKLANELLKNNPELINNKFTFLVHIADNKQNKCKTLLFKILNEKINSWWY
jgi:hypothetical protein